MRFLRFDDINSRNQRLQFDKLAPIREFHTQFIQNCQNSYSVGEFVTIDEMLVSFRGRCGFIQYMPQKPAKYGLKIYALCDARTFYTFNLDIYCGKQKDGPYMTSNKPFDICKRMTIPIINSNRNLTTDNYFSSYELAEYLLGVGLTFLGTLKRNKREVPPEFILDKNRMPGTSITGCQYDKTLVSYVTKKKKVVLLLSIMHDSIKLDENTRKPVQIVDYNSSKGGVDTVDLMSSTYTTARKTKRWPVVIFFRELEIAGINSLKIFLANNPEKNYSRRHLFELSMELMEQNLKKRSELKSLPKDIDIFLSKYRDNSISEIAPSKVRPICSICGPHKNNKTGVIYNNCKKHVCKHHSVRQVACDKNNSEVEEDEEV